LITRWSSLWSRHADRDPPVRLPYSGSAVLYWSATREWALREVFGFGFDYGG
jgi:hypothetical protein